MKLVWFLLLLTWALPLFAQYTLERRYTLADGLPMTESRYAAFDGEYLWVLSTSGMLSRFDGQLFEDYTEVIGHRGWIYSLSPDHQLVCTSAQKDSRFWTDLRLHRRGEIIKLSGLPEEGVIPVTDAHGTSYLRFVSKDSLWVYDKEDLSLVATQALPIRLDTVGLIMECNLKKNEEIVIVCRSSESNGRNETYGYILSGSQAGKYLPPGSPEIYGIDLASGESLQLKTPFTYSTELDPGEARLLHEQLGLPRPKREVFYHLTNPFFFQQERSSAPSAELDQLSIWSLKTNPLRIEEEWIRSRIQSGYDVNLATTADGSLWITDHSGLRRFHPAVRVFRSGSGEMIGALHAIVERPGGEFWFGGYGTGFARYLNGEVERIDVEGAPATTKVMPAAYADTMGNAYFMDDSSHRLIHIDAAEKVTETKFITYTGYGASGFHLRPATLPASSPLRSKRKSSNSFLVAGLSVFLGEGQTERYGALGLIELQADGSLGDCQLIDHRKGVRITNVLTTASDPDQRIWFAHTRTGMGVYDPVLDTVHCALPQRGEEFGAMAMAFDQRGTLWMGTNDGLAYLEHAADLPFNRVPELIDQVRYLTVDALPADANRIFSLTIRHDSLFFGHQSGLGFLELSKFYQSDRGDFPCYSFNTLEHGMGSAEQNALLFDTQGRLWLGTDEGALRFDIDRLLSQRHRPILESLLLTGDQDSLQQTDSVSYFIPTKDRSLEFGYNLSTRDLLQGDARVHVLLSNAAGDTILYRQNLPPRQMERVKYLLPGTYTLKYVLRYDNQTVDERLLKIDVPRTFWEKPLNWLIAGAVILLPFLIVLLAQVRIARKDAALQKTLKKQEALQVMALVGTINPHFITNSLQWVQSAVRQKKDDDEINRIVGSLGDNIRTVFNLAYERKAGHSLADELTLVKKYLDSVSLLTANRYDYQLPESQKIADLGHYQIILLELQVHVENAVEHGLRNRPQATGITIGLRHDEHYIYLTVEDDGGGITRAQRNPGIGSRKGRKMLEELHEIFNRRNERKISTQFESDLYPEPGAPEVRFGTRVTITIPKIYSYDLETAGS